MQIQDVMQKDVIAVNCYLSVLELEKTLSNKRISGAPVVSDTGELMGIVSMRDVMQKLTAALTKKSAALKEILGSVKAYEIMTPNILTVGPTEDVREVAKKMVEKQVHRVIVMSDKNGIMGLATSFDLLRAFADPDA